MRKSLSMYIFQYLFLLDIFLQLEEKMLKSFHNYLFPTYNYNIAGRISSTIVLGQNRSIPQGLSNRQRFPGLSRCEKCPQVSNF